MNIMSGTDSVLLNLNRNQQNEATLVSRLSSGLRIQTAADDPSGYAISQTLQTKVNGLQQAVENVQNGSNALTVADSAAASVQVVLQRVRSLVVESNSDLNSNAQLQSIQTEINQLLLEVNRISQNTNFNGLTLLDGSHDTTVSNPNATPTITEVNPGLMPDGTSPTGDTVSNPQNPSGDTAKLVQNLAESLGYASNFSGLFVFKITGYSTNPVDPVAGPLGQPGVYVQIDEYSTSSVFANNQGNYFEQISALPTGAGWDFSSGGPVSQAIPTGSALQFDMPNLSAADVGTAIAFEITAPQQSSGGTAINLNDGGQEGSVVPISLPSLSTSSLGISDISVLNPTSVSGPPPTPVAPTGIVSSNQMAATDAEFRVDNALNSVSQLRATLGAQMVSLNEDANNATTSIVNYQASVSSITDLNVGSAVTEFTREQIMTQIGTGVLSQMQIHTTQLMQVLFANL